MPSRLLADEHIPMQVVHTLRKMGHDVETVRQISMNKTGDGISDDEILQYAIHVDRAVITENRRDFDRLHESMRGHKGIIACRQFNDWKDQAKQIDDAVKRHRHLDGQYIPIPFNDDDPSAPKRVKKGRRG